MIDLISRQAAIEAVGEVHPLDYNAQSTVNRIKKIPAATLYGYNIDHLMLIARVLEEKDIPPEYVADMAKNVGRTLELVIDSFNAYIDKTIKEQIPLTETPKEEE